MAPHLPPWYKQLWRMRNTFVLILIPLVLIPLPAVVKSPAARCAYGIIIMAFFWMTEVIPMAVTALLPVVIFPWLSIMDSKKICEKYFSDSNMLFFGGLMVAVAVEKWNLHKRIAMRVLLIVGSKPKWLLFGFMSTTAFLSMWISNTATTAMMVPISHAVLNELTEHRKKQTKEKRDKAAQLGYQNNGFSSDSSKHSTQFSSLQLNEENTEKQVISEEDLKMDAWYERVGRGLRLSIAYAANIGGTATLTGTGPNLVLKGQLDTIYGSDNGINFSSWFVLAFPNMMISLFLAWVWLIIMFIGPRELVSIFFKSPEVEEDNTATDVIRKEYEKLGPMSFAEVIVLIDFIILALLWLTKNPEFVPGWSSLFANGNWITDACVAITMSSLLFMLPSRPPNFLCFNRWTKKWVPEDTEVGPSEPLLDWQSVHKHIPWNVLILLGGGFAMAEACKESGLSKLIGEFFRTLQHLPTWSLVFILSTLTAVFTEVTSNVATATIFLPILANLAEQLHINPLYLMLPVTISASFAFMLPVATPPNAIVFAYGNMKIVDMMKAGVVMNTICLLVLQLSINTYGHAYFHLGTFPQWAGNISTAITNSTLLANATV